jgi:hypothetical protein
MPRSRRGGAPRRGGLAETCEDRLFFQSDRVAELLGQHDAPAVVDLEIGGLGVEEVFELLAFFAERGEFLYEGVDDPHLGHGEAFETRKFGAAMDEDEGGKLARGAVGIAGIQHAAKRSGDRHATLCVDLVDRLASEAELQTASLLSQTARNEKAGRAA